MRCLSTTIGGVVATASIFPSVTRATPTIAASANGVTAPFAAPMRKVIIAVYSAAPSAGWSRRTRLRPLREIPDDQPRPATRWRRRIAGGQISPRRRRHRPALAPRGERFCCDIRGSPCFARRLGQRRHASLGRPPHCAPSRHHRSSPGIARMRALRVPESQPRVGRAARHWDRTFMSAHVILDGMIAQQDVHRFRHRCPPRRGSDLGDLPSWSRSRDFTDLYARALCRCRVDWIDADGASGDRLAAASGRPVMSCRMPGFSRFSPHRPCVDDPAAGPRFGPCFFDPHPCRAARRVAT